MFYVLPCCSFTYALCFTIVQILLMVQYQTHTEFMFYVLPHSIFGNNRSRPGSYFCRQSHCFKQLPRFMFYILPCGMCQIFPKVLHREVPSFYIFGVYDLYFAILLNRKVAGFMFYVLYLTYLVLFYTMQYQKHVFIPQGHQLGLCFMLYQ